MSFGKKTEEENEVIIYPYIVFKAADRMFCASSEYIRIILQLPHYDKLPESPPYVTGIFPYMDGVVRMIDLRTVLGARPLKDEYGGFCDMIDTRKEDHIFWVEELERVLETGEEFTKATDPHKCALGKWYDQFSSDNEYVMAHLRKLNEPHIALHRAAEEAFECEKKCDSCEREECLNSILDKVKEVYVPKIMTLLDESKEIFKESIYHELVLVLNTEESLGLVVDEVVSVEMLESVQEDIGGMAGARYIKDVKRSEKLDDMILEIDIPTLLGTLDLGVAG